MRKRRKPEVRGRKSEIEAGQLSNLTKVLAFIKKLALNIILYQLLGEN